MVFPVFIDCVCTSMFLNADPQPAAFCRSPRECEPSPYTRWVGVNLCNARLIGLGWFPPAQHPYVYSVSVGAPLYDLCLQPGYIPAGGVSPRRFFFFFCEEDAHEEHADMRSPLRAEYMSNLRAEC